MANVTQESLINTWGPLGVVGLISESDIPKDPTAVDYEELAVPLLRTAELQDGGKYVLIYGKHPLKDQVGTYFHMLAMTSHKGI